MSCNEVFEVQSVPDFNNLAWSTLHNLFGLPPSPLSEEDSSNVLRIVVSCKAKYRVVYANPQAAICADVVSKQFVQGARRAQLSWLLWLKSNVFFQSARLKREIKKCSYLQRQLQFLGVLIVDRKLIDPGKWPKGERTLSKQSHKCPPEQNRLMHSGIKVWQPVSN